MKVHTIQYVICDCESYSLKDPQSIRDSTSYEMQIDQMPLVWTETSYNIYIYIYIYIYTLCCINDIS